MSPAPIVLTSGPARIQTVANPGPADRPRQLVPASRARRDPHARRRLRRLQRHGARIRASSSRRSAPGCTSSRATASGSRSSRSSRAARCGSTTRTSTSPTTSATRRSRGPATTRSSSGSPGRVFSQALDRARPLWELWLVEGLADERFALLSKTHHALVDGISGVDIATVLFDTSPDPMPVAPPEHEWIARPLPTAPQLLADALLERATVPGEIVRGVRRVAARARARSPTRVGTGARRGRRDDLGGTAVGAAEPVQRADRTAPPLHLGPRRARRVQGDQERRSAGPSTTSCWPSSPARSAATCACTASRPTDVELKAMVPVSVRADVERGALGNRVAAMWAPLPVGRDRPGRSGCSRSAPRWTESRSPARPSAPRC